MAAIGNIRKHYGLQVVIVGIALLAFVLGDLFKSTNSRQTTNVATVDGKKITYQDYSNLVNMNLENVKAQNGGSLSTEDNYSVHANTLEQMIRDIIMKKEYTISSQEKTLTNMQFKASQILMAASTENSSLLTSEISRHSTLS